MRVQAEGDTRDIWEDHEDYPEEFPLPASVSCGECSETYDYEECTVDFEVLCSDCAVLRVWKRDTTPEDWPCLLAGEPCNPQVDAYRCSLDMNHECVEGAWALSEDCSAGQDCCESGCVSVTD